MVGLSIQIDKIKGQKHLGSFSRITQHNNNRNAPGTSRGRILAEVCWCRYIRAVHAHMLEFISRSLESGSLK